MFHVLLPSGDKPHGHNNVIDNGGSRKPYASASGKGKSDKHMELNVR